MSEFEEGWRSEGMRDVGGADDGIVRRGGIRCKEVGEALFLSLAGSGGDWWRV